MKKMEKVVYRCKRCGSELEPSEVEGYAFTCKTCDEDMYSFEATVGIEIPCHFGTIRAEVAGDPGIYDEIEIDLIRDGKVMQLCVAGTGPDPRGDGYDLHVYVWDGSDESPTHSINPDMDTEYWW